MTHPLIGRQLGNYVVRTLIGEGGMGAVFLGAHRFLNDEVAIKVLHGRYADDPQVAKRFVQEATVTRDIDDPSVIDIKDFGQSDDGALYLVMELLRGQSLAARIHAAPLDERTAAAVAAAVADCLAIAHRKGVVHRDLKPDNIFLAERPPRDARAHRAVTLDGAQRIIKVLDFGIAKVLHAATMTGTRAILGTPAYMAPEQTRQSKLVDEKADVYALGAILFEMTSGRTPFSGDDPMEVLIKVNTDPVPRPTAMGAKISPAMEALILECLAKQPAERPANMGDVRDRLQALMAPAREPSQRTTLKAEAPALAPEPAIAPTPAATSPAPAAALVESKTPSLPTAGEVVSRTRPRGGRRWVWPSLVVGTALIAGGIAWPFLHGGKGGAPPDARAEFERAAQAGDYDTAIEKYAALDERERAAAADAYAAVEKGYYDHHMMLVRALLAVPNRDCDAIEREKDLLLAVAPSDSVVADIACSTPEAVVAPPAANPPGDDAKPKTKHAHHAAAVEPTPEPEEIHAVTYRAEKLLGLVNHGISVRAVKFALDRDTLLPSSDDQLGEIRQLLIDHPDLNLVVEGHTDTLGSPEHNRRLSAQRALSVKAWLVAHGIDGARIDAVGYGETRPIADNRTAQGRAANRRIELHRRP